VRLTATPQPPTPTPVPPTATDTPVPPSATPEQESTPDDPPPTLPGAGAPTSERLEQARLLLHNGDYAAASSVYQAILAAPLEPAEVAEARYGR
jgi:hypothetical protein